MPGPSSGMNFLHFLALPFAADIIGKFDCLVLREIPANAEAVEASHFRFTYRTIFAFGTHVGRVEVTKATRRIAASRTRHVKFRQGIQLLDRPVIPHQVARRQRGQEPHLVCQPHLVPEITAPPKKQVLQVVKDPKVLKIPQAKKDETQCCHSDSPGGSSDRHAVLA